MKYAWSVLILGGISLAGCDDLGDFAHVKEDFHYSYAMPAGGHLNVENTNGSVEIVGWDRNTIDVSGTKFAANGDRLREINIKVSVNGNSASIVTETPKDFWHGSFGAKYLIRVPGQTMIENVRTTNGTVNVEDLRGGGHVTSTNGRISLTRDTGDYDVHTTNGAIELQDCSGNERAHTTNGGVHGRLKAGAINAQSQNGGIDVTIEQPQDGQPLRASTTNGGITLALEEFHDNSITADTTNGGVTLRLPANVDAKVKLDTSVSSISNDLTLSSTEETSKHHLSGQLGKGGPLISASTTTGSIHLERY